MNGQSGRRQRKKAATRKAIADTALRMFLERGYDAVGIRDIAGAADVAITTVFAHFPSKEAIVFDEDDPRGESLVRAVTGREPGVPILQALRQQVRAVVREFERPGSAAFWRLVDGSPALREYASTMWLRHADALAAAIAADLGLVEPSAACRALARFVLEVFPLARASANPAAAVDEIFDLMSSGWDRAIGARSRVRPGAPQVARRPSPGSAKSRPDRARR